MKSKSSKKKQKKQDKKTHAQAAKLTLENQSISYADTNGRVESPDGEMSCFYVDPITGEIQTVSIEHDKLLYENKQKQRYRHDFGISEHAYKLAAEFFDEYKNDYAMCINFLKQVITASISQRNDITCTEEDIFRFLNMLDVDNDGQINLREFFQLLILFLATKSTLEKRVNGTLLEQSYTHETEGYLTLDEGQNFRHYLYTLYGKTSYETNDSGFIEKLYNNLENIDTEKIDYEEVDYSQYSKEISINLEELCFVRDV